jgi:hypothetical protein
MNLVVLSSSELDKVLTKAGYSSAHDFKSDIMGTSHEISRFDIFKDEESSDRDVYVALKSPNQMDNYEQAGYTLY